mgnify:CR=1 FL=1
MYVVAASSSILINFVKLELNLVKYILKNLEISYS